MRILGIDPGSVVCGYGVIQKDGSKLSLVEYGVVEAKKKNLDFNPRLQDIFERISQVVARSKPDVASFEAMFYHKNPQTLIKLSHARGAAMVAVLNSGIKLEEYSAKEIKKAVAGSGNASKEQIQFMVKNILKLEETHKFFDATDALAAAICHAVRASAPTSSSNSWADYIKNNPHKVAKF